MKVLETARLVLRRLDTEDASFMFRLLNDPSWIQNIGDKGIRTLDDAKELHPKWPSRNVYAIWIWAVSRTTKR